jgi:ribosome-associated protein
VKKASPMPAPEPAIELAAVPTVKPKPAPRPRKPAAPSVAPTAAPRPAPRPRKPAATNAATKVARPKPAKAAIKAAAGSDAPPHSIGLPKRPRPARKTAASARLDMARRIVALAEDKKAADILLLDLDGLTTLADAFVICSGGSERQLESIAEGIVRGMREEGIRPIGREGLPASHWILVDFGDVIVHIFTPPERDYYGLEKHWSEAKAILRVQ